MIIKTCPQCQKEFEIKKYISITSFCSKRCQRKYNSDKRISKVPTYFKDIDKMIKAARE